MFENVTYTFYTTTLGRSAVPSEAVFNSYKLENLQYTKRMLPFLTEREENGVDSAVCMMIEVDYLEAQAQLPANQEKKSESLDGYSYTLDTNASNQIQTGNFKTTEQKKKYWIDMFCDYYGGIK